MIKREHILIGIGAGFIAGYQLGYLINRRRRPEGMTDDERADYELTIERKNMLIERLRNALDSRLPDHDGTDQLLEEVKRYREEPIDELVGSQHRRMPDDGKPDLAEIAGRQLGDEDEPEAPVATVPADPDMPYVITKEEFQLNEKDYEQATYTWYKRSDDLIAENGRPVDDVLNLVGFAWKKEFGNRRNETWVRNDELGVEIEIVREPGSWEGPDDAPEE
jgi:hypothetical protein